MRCGRAKRINYSYIDPIDYAHDVCNDWIWLVWMMTCQFDCVMFSSMRIDI